MGKLQRAFFWPWIATSAAIRARATFGMLAITILLSASARSAPPSPVTITILHTNDLHSQFRAEKTELGLGGLARLKTAISRARARNPHTLLVDGGDWSEGSIYYTEGAGSETLKLMDHLTYDAAVVGNHDWYNGVDVLLDAIRRTGPQGPKVKLLASNISTSKYKNEGEFRKLIPPYWIREIGGARVAFIGLLTYEFIYDAFFDPIQIKEPFGMARELSRQLKKHADVVVAISHNSIRVNRGVLEAAPDIDLVIGAHDHVKLTKPVIVERPGARPAWIVEAGSWGRYLGRVEMRVTARDPKNAQSKPSVELVGSGLQQMDASVPEDPETVRRIEELEQRIEKKWGPILHDHLADSEVELSRHGQEHLMGNFATDAYVAASGADLALDQSSMIYGEIHEGPVTTADVFNSNPGIYDPSTHKSWTLHTLPIRGRALSWLLNLLYSVKGISQKGLTLSGAEIVYKPLLGRAQKPGAPISPDEPDVFAGVRGEPGQDPTANGISIQSFKIRGQPLDPKRTYQIAAPGGIVLSLQFIKRALPGAIPIDQLKDTGLEDWRIMADYLAAKSPLTRDEISYGRVRTAHADLGMLHNDVTWEPQGVDAQGRRIARIRAVVTNQGIEASSAGTESSGPRVSLLLNQNGADYAVDPVYVDAAPSRPLPALSSGESVTVAWDDVRLPSALGNLYPVTARIDGSDDEVNRSNDEVTRHFRGR
jgi:5'-nucleotidase/UDP-sugar diphosphatase